MCALFRSVIHHVFSACSLSHTSHLPSLPPHTPPHTLSCRLSTVAKADRNGKTSVKPTTPHPLTTPPPPGAATAHPPTTPPPPTTTGEGLVYCVYTTKMCSAESCAMCTCTCDCVVYVPGLFLVCALFRNSRHIVHYRMWTVWYYRQTTVHNQYSVLHVHCTCCGTCISLTLCNILQAHSSPQCPVCLLYHHQSLQMNSQLHTH